jgi:hypothetical protein
MTQQPRYSVVGTLVLAVFWGMMLSGCSDLGDFLGDILRINDDAEAQDQSRIRIFAISPGTFVLTSDLEPTIDLNEGYTQYTLQADGILTLGSGESLALDIEDRIIERPASNTVTVISRD